MKPKENPRPSPIAAGTSSVALLGLLAALALALSFLEGLLPALPVPGAKLGLSNIVTMYALTALSLPAALGITAVKAVFALLRGGSAFLMSAAGGCSAPSSWRSACVCSGERWGISASASPGPWPITRGNGSWPCC